MYYHGTCFGDLIIEEGTIKPTTAETIVYGEDQGSFATTDGFIYLATDTYAAADFSARAYGSLYEQQKSLSGYIHIFECDIGELEEYKDIDELKLEALDPNKLSLEEAKSKTKTLRVKGNLKIGEHVKRYKKFEVENISQIYSLIDDKKIEKQQWIDL